jgi:exosortase
MVQNPSSSALAIHSPAKWVAGSVLLSSLVCFQTLVEAAQLSFRDGRYNYVLVTLAVTLVLFYRDRDHLFRLWPVNSEDKFGGLLAVIGLASNLLLTYVVGADLYWRFLALVLCWMGSLWHGYGFESVRRAGFHLLLLAAAAPVPKPWIHNFEVFLQYLSADVSNVIFRLLGTTVYREGLVFALPTMNVEVARECSGIRSTTALILIVAVCGYLMLRNPWLRVMFLLLAVPAGILKNAVRIVTLALLGSDVSPDYLTGPLHKQGGPLFTLTAILVLGPALWMLMRAEQWKTAKQPASPQVHPQ